MGPHFELGQLLATPGSLRVCEELEMSPMVLFLLHAHLDPGDLDEHDQQVNQEALKNGSRIFSAFQVGDHRFYVITEATRENGQRETTTILLAHEY